MTSAIQSTVSHLNENASLLLNNNEDFFKRQLSTDSINHSVNKNNVFSDVLGDGEILRRVITSGQGRESRPTHGDLVTVEIEAFLHCGDPKVSTTGENVMPKQSLEFVLGDGDVIQAIDLCTTLAEKSEHFEFITSHRFAYGEKGLPPNIPGSAFLLFRVVLNHVTDAPDYSRLSELECLRMANFKRERGNILYRQEEYNLAVNSYSKAIKILQKHNKHLENRECLEVLILSYSNMAAAQLKIEAYQGALESSDFVLLYQPTNVKAIFRKAKALMGLKDFSKAMVLLKQALELEPESQITRLELQRCTSDLQQERERQALLFRRMIGSLKEDSSTSTSSSRSSNKFLLQLKQTLSNYGLPLLGVLGVGSALLLALYLTQETNQISLVQEIQGENITNSTNI